MEVVKENKYLGEGGSFKADEEEEEEDKENIQNLSLDNIKIGRVDDGLVKKEEEMEYGSCCDSSHDEGNSILHNFRWHKVLFYGCLKLFSCSNF